MARRDELQPTRSLYGWNQLILGFPPPAAGEKGYECGIYLVTNRDYPERQRAFETALRKLNIDFTEVPITKIPKLPVAAMGANLEEAIKITVTGATREKCQQELEKVLRRIGNPSAVERLDLGYTELTNKFTKTALREIGNDETVAWARAEMEAALRDKEVSPPTRRR